MATENRFDCDAKQQNREKHLPIYINKIFKKYLVRKVMVNNPVSKLNVEIRGM